MYQLDKHQSKREEGRLTMEKVKTDFLAFLEERKAECQKQIEQLCADNRRDESNFFRAKLNIYDVCRSLYEAAEKQCSGELEKVAQMFPEMVKRIADQWQMSRQVAEQHGDESKVIMETRKLEAVAEVLEMFQSLTDAE